MIEQSATPRRAWAGDVLFAFYVLLCVTLVLYVYRIPVAGANLSVFRIVVLLWVLSTAASVLARIRGTWKINRRLSSVLVLLAGILIINALDFVELANHPVLRRDIENHLFNLVFAGVVAFHVNSETRLRLVLRAFALSSLATTYVTLYAMVTGGVPFEALLRALGGGQGLALINDDTFVRRATATFYDPNLYAVYSVLVIGSVLYLRRVGSAGPWLTALIPLNLVILGLTVSRTGVIAAFAMFTIVWALQPRLRRIAAVAALLVLPCFWVATAFQTHKTRAALAQDAGLLWSSARAALVPGSDSSRSPVSASAEAAPAEHGKITGRIVDGRSIGDRLNHIQNGWRVFTESPIFGAGSASLLAPDIPFSSAHVTYLTLAARYGVVGMAIYVAFMLWPIAAVWYDRGLRHPHVSLLLSTVGVLWIVYLSYDLFLFFEIQYLPYGIGYALAFRGPDWPDEVGERVIVTVVPARDAMTLAR